jgi:ParB family chromosome partitioning protein
VGRSRAAVTNTLRLLQLPSGVQRAVAEGAISAGHARALLGTPDRVLQERLVGRIVAEGLTVRAVEELLRATAASDEETSLSPTPSPVATEPVVAGAPAGGTVPVAGSPGAAGGAVSSRPPLPEPGVVELEELLATYLNTRVKVEMHQRRGRLQIEFATLEDLERIYRLMVGDPAGATVASDAP